VPGAKPTITLSAPQTVPVNANNHNGSAWNSAQQTHIPTIRDFSVTTPTTYEDTELRSASVVVTGGLAGTLYLTATSTSYSSEVPTWTDTQITFWSDKKKTMPVSSVQIPAVNNGTNQYTYNFEIEGVHEAFGSSDNIRITAEFKASQVPITILDTKLTIVTPVIEGLDHTIGSANITFAGNGNPMNGLNGLTTKSLPNNTGVRKPGIKFDVWNWEGNSPDFQPGNLLFLQSVIIAANGPNAAGNIGPGITLINPANQLNMKISQAGINVGAAFPLSDGGENFFYPTILSQTNPWHHFTEDSPEILLPANVGPRTTRVDMRVEYIMYYIVGYADHSIYTLSHNTWSVNYLSSSAAPNNGILTTIDPNSKVTSSGWIRSNQDPSKTVGPFANQVLYPH
jgi:hypothetical protein